MSFGSLNAFYLTSIFALHIMRRIHTNFWHLWIWRHPVCALLFMEYFRFPMFLFRSFCRWKSNGVRVESANTISINKECSSFVCVELNIRRGKHFSQCLVFLFFRKLLNLRFFNGRRVRCVQITSNKSCASRLRNIVHHANVWTPQLGMPRYHSSDGLIPETHAHRAHNKWIIRAKSVRTSARAEPFPGSNFSFVFCGDT